MPSKSLQWIAIAALLLAFWIEWVRSSFGVLKDGWVDVVVAAAMLFNIVVQLLALRAIRKQAPR